MKTLGKVVAFAFLVLSGCDYSPIEVGSTLDGGPDGSPDICGCSCGKLDAHGACVSGWKDCSGATCKQP